MQNTLDFGNASARERFLRFHNENPHVYAALVRYARELKRAGVQRAGIRLLWERLRWDETIRTSGVPFKMSDHHTSFYSRLIMLKERDLMDFFDTRKGCHVESN